MGAFLRRQRVLVGVILLTFGWCVAFALWIDWVSTPLRIPVSLSSVGSYEAKFQIRESEKDRLQLIFEPHGASDTYLEYIAGTGFVCAVFGKCFSDISVPIRWSITRLGEDEPVVADDVVMVNAGKRLLRRARPNYTYMRLLPGQYSFKAEVLQPVPELAGIFSSIALKFRFKLKGSHSWQVGYIWYGQLIFLIILPIAAIAGLMLLWRAGHALWTSRRATTAH